MIFTELLLGFTMAIFSMAVSVNKSRGFQDLSEKFAKFDALTLRFRYPSGDRSWTIYLFTVVFIGVYNMVYVAFTRTKDIFYILLMWNIMCASTMLPVFQYTTFIRMLRERYTSANAIFINSECTLRGEDS